MRRSSFAAYVAAGALCMNSVPHFLIAATGRRNVTPFGRHSSAPVNLLWAVLNAGSGYAVLRFADQRSGATVDGTQWQLPFELGCVGWASVGVVYAGATARSLEA